MVIACGFVLNYVCLTYSLRDDGELGGVTDWLKPLALAPSLDRERDAARQDDHCFIVMVLYAGQEAERILSQDDPTVIVPKSDENWKNDNQEAAKHLACIQSGDLERDDAEKLMRACTAQHVRRYWRAVTSVAQELLEPPAVSTPRELHVQGRAIQVARRVLSRHDIARHVHMVEIAERAYLKWKARGDSAGSELDDWLEAEREILQMAHRIR